MQTKPTAAKRKAPPKAKAVPATQTTLDTLLKLNTAHASGLERIINLLTAMRPAPRIALARQEEVPAPENGGASMQLTALLSIISGKGAQQVFEDILARGIPPTAQDWLREVEKFIARSAGKVDAA